MYQGQSSVSKGPYRPLSPRVGPASAAAAHSSSASAASAQAGAPPCMRPRQVIVSSPGSPSSSSDSQSGSDSVKHCLSGRVGSPSVRASPSPAQQMMRASPSVGLGSAHQQQMQMRGSPSIAGHGAQGVNSPVGPRNSPSVSSLSRMSPSVLSQVRPCYFLSNICLTFCVWF